MLRVVAILGLMATACGAGEDRPATPSTSPAAVPGTAILTEVEAAQPATAVSRIDTPPPSEEIAQLLSRLRLARQRLGQWTCYSAQFTQQVRKDGRLLHPESIALKVQHEPFAVYLKWDRDGQEALFVAGENDDKLLVHPTRGFGRLRQVWKLEPDSRLAMRGSLRPVTEIGLSNLVELLLGFHEPHILNSRCVLQQADEGDHAGDRPLTRFVLTFDDRRDNPYFAKTILWLCDEQDIPLRIDNYGWTDDGQLGPLLESYAYDNLCTERCVTPADFELDKDAYPF